MLPEFKDIDYLINLMINEFYSNNNKDISIPIRAGILVYQFVTIHTFWEGNSRCSRLLIF